MKKWCSGVENSGWRLIGARKNSGMIKQGEGAPVSSVGTEMHASWETSRKNWSCMWLQNYDIVGEIKILCQVHATEVL